MSRSILTTLLATLAALSLAASPARAAAGEHAWSIGVGSSFLFAAVPGDTASTALRAGPELQAGYRYALSDFWQIAGRLVGGFYAGGGRAIAGAGALQAEARYVIDALIWVPYIAGGLGLLVRSDGAWSAGGARARFDLTAHLGIGVDYRPRRAWSAGVAVRYFVIATDAYRTSGPIELSLSVSFF